jgi:hypothetical protein
MSKITNIEKYKSPHYVIETWQGAHVIPEETMKRVTAGDMLFSEIDLFDELAATIVAEWMRYMPIAKDYNELLMAVENKYEGETRHQTALRYIQEAERSCNGPSAPEA